jgi:hypothetical protein
MYIHTRVYIYIYTCTHTLTNTHIDHKATPFRPDNFALAVGAKVAVIRYKFTEVGRQSTPLLKGFSSLLPGHKTQPLA